MRRTPLALVPLALVLLLVLAAGRSAGVAQVETPVASPPTAPLASPVATPPADLTGVAALPLTDARRAAFEAYVADALNRLAVPGAAVAVVQGGEVVYLQGFGVKEVGGTQRVTPDTLMMIGSVTKSMTSTMAATLVDEGWLSWDTPVADLLPAFAFPDPALTERLTVADAFCACTGLPRRDLEIIFNFDALPPERLIASVAEFPVTAPFGEAFQYNNQLYAVGGYAATVAAGGAPTDLFAAYRLAMRDRFLGPLGMERSTFALEQVLTSGDYAVPHGADLEGQTRPFPLLADDRFVGSVAPAGALWSSARDMARYVQMELADGVAADGTRVVSAENLDRTRAPRTAIPAPPGLPPLLYEGTQAYGLGWGVGAYKGQPLVSHSGGTLGFVSEVAFLPEADLGVVILTNGGAGAGPFTLGVQNRLFELLFDQPAEFDPLLGQLLEAGAAQAAQLRPVDPAAVAPYLGQYANPALGEVELRLEGERLVFDAGEIRSEVRGQADAAGQVSAYVLADPPLTGGPIALRQDADGRPEIAVVIEGEGAETYVFTRLEPLAAATPAA
jgi:CubicO group peptidase (beta-lactamase class C family)